MASRDHPHLEGIHKSEYKWPQLKFEPSFPTVFSFDKCLAAVLRSISKLAIALCVILYGEPFARVYVAVISNINICSTTVALYQPMQNL